MKFKSMGPLIMWHRAPYAHINMMDRLLKNNKEAQYE